MRKNEKERIKEADMQEVNIYTATTAARGPAIRKEAYYIYVLEYKGTKTITRVGRGRLENVTGNYTELTALISALRRITKPCSIRVFTRSEHVLHTIQNNWPVQWEKNEWIKSSDKPVKNKELWQQYVNMTRNHVIEITDKAHEYSMWLDSELEKMKENNDGKKHNAE